MFETVIPLIHKSQSFVISGHVNPEGDCVGSIFALMRLLECLGKKTRIICHDPVPQNLDFLGLSWELMDDIKDKPGADCLIALDTPRVERLGSVASIIDNFSRIIVIDHHVSCCEFGSVNVVDPAASSCGEMIYQLYKEMECSIPQDVAAMLYVALSTDTGSFRYSNTTQRTFQIAADLVSSGFDVHSINESIYSHIRQERFYLLKRFLSNVSFSSAGEIAWSVLSSDDLDECGATSEDMEGFVNYIRDIKGVRIAFFAFEKKDAGIIKFSLRAKGTADVNQLAGHFGGGGHTKAAGCKYTGTRDEAIELMLQHAESQILGSVKGE